MIFKPKSVIGLTLKGEVRSLYLGLDPELNNQAFEKATSDPTLQAVWRYDHPQYSAVRYPSEELAMLKVAAETAAKPIEITKTESKKTK